MRKMKHKEFKKLLSEYEMQEIVFRKKNYKR